MTREEIKNYILTYIDNNLTSDYIKDRIDIIESILFELEVYLDFKNETIDKILKLIYEESIFR